MRRPCLALGPSLGSHMTCMSSRLSRSRARSPVGRRWPAPYTGRASAHSGCRAARRYLGHPRGSHSGAFPAPPATGMVSRSESEPRIPMCVIPGLDPLGRSSFFSLPTSLDGTNDRLPPGGRGHVRRSRPADPYHGAGSRLPAASRRTG
jgi:hypothetical protein